MVRPRIILIGFGFAGQVFHAPLFAPSGLDLVAVVTSKEATFVAEKVRKNVPVFSTLEVALKSASETFDLVVIATPNSSHFTLGMMALEHGKHVVIDKPFTLTVAEADKLIAKGKEKNLVLSCFHNRQWDSDFLTLRAALPRLGEVVTFHSTYQRWRPKQPANWRWDSATPGCGLLCDLGPHLVMQAVELFGLPKSLTCITRSQRGSGVDDCFLLVLHYPERPDLLVQLDASCLVASALLQGSRVITVHGRNGTFQKSGIDPQEADLIAGKTPSHAPEWGREPDSQAATFTSVNEQGAARSEMLPIVPGNYLIYYEGIRDAISGKAVAPPILATDARNVMVILEAAASSAAAGGTCVKLDFAEKKE